MTSSSKTATKVGPQRPLAGRKLSERPAWLVRVVIVASVVLVSLVGGLGLKTPEAQAAQFVQVRGTTYSSTKVCARDSSGQDWGCVWSNGITGSTGQYLIMLPTDRHVFLYAVKQRGCNVYYDSTPYFYFPSNGPSAYFNQKPLWPDKFWYKAC